MDYVTDTHPIVWYFTEDPRLSVTALQVFEGTIKEGIIIVPAIVLAEIMFIAKRGKISLGFEDTLKKIQEYENIDIAPLDVDTLKGAHKIEVDLEMHDKLIVATAICFNATLITKDHFLRNSGICPTIW